MSTPVSMERRRFLDISGKYGFTVAVLASSGGYLWSDSAVAQTSADEEKKKKAALYQMTFATEYKVEDVIKYPIMQGAFKDNVQNLSKGKMYVRLFPAGQLAVGAALAQRVQAGTVQGASLSLSNFSPYTKTVDLINIPYWCGENQKFANLVTSKTWNDDITPKVLEKGFKPMFYFTARRYAGHESARTAVKAIAEAVSFARRKPNGRCVGRDGHGD
jgi:TRAP-type C4-dicarboxylate transport system substrate-binding protein